ncbi:MAG: MliC family protein [Wenzhouxiangella sp.]
MNTSTRLMKTIVMAVAGLALVGCGRDSGEPDQAESSAAVQLTGEAFYAERIVMPPGSWLEVELVDEEADHVLARQRLEDIGAPPYPFELNVGQGALRPDGAYTVLVTLFLPDGSPRFAAESPVDPNRRDTSTIQLQAVDYSEQDREVEDTTEWISWRCEEIPVDVRVTGDDKAVLVLPWQDHALQVEPSASGAHYWSEAIEFWSRGHESARLSLESRPDIDCRPADDASPWTAARERGIGFRASGNEPGWLMEVRNGDQARLHLLLDYGAHELNFDDITVLPDQNGFIAHAPGNHVEIQLIHETCHDTMVDWTFPVRVEMTLNDLNMSACGRFFGVPLP